MTTCTPIEERLLSASNRGDLSEIIHLVSRLTIKERESVNPTVYDKLLFSITHPSNEPVEQAYATMMFIRHVGRYVSPATVSALLKKPAQAAAPSQSGGQVIPLHRRVTDNIAV